MRWFTAGVLVLTGGLLGFAPGCAEGENLGGSGAGGGSCIPGASLACECPSGEMGARVCGADGLGYAPCSCLGMATDGEGSSTGEPPSVSASGSGSTGLDGEICGDAIEDPGECDPDDPAFCPEDCAAQGGTTTGDACAGAPTFFGAIVGITSRWEHNGFVGFAAGDAMCQELGGDHVCDYEEIVEAEGKGELAGIAAGTTAWLHRNVDANGPGGIPSPPGLGGRCVDWTYSTNHLSDGEYVEFTPAGPQYFIDNDTFYDGTSTEHTQTDLLQCGNQMRSLLCCHAACS